MDAVHPPLRSFVNAPEYPGGLALRWGDKNLVDVEGDPGHVTSTVHSESSNGRRSSTTLSVVRYRETPTAPLLIGDSGALENP
jgi:hypothetical protein